MSKPKPVFESVIDTLASVKLAIAVLFILAAAAIAGTVIPQNLEPGQYMQGYGPRLYTFFYYLDLFDMYHSWWFNLLLVLLVVNLTVCSIRRLPVTMQLAKPAGPGKIKPDFLRKQSFSRSATIKGTVEDNLDDLTDQFSRGFTLPGSTRTEWGTLLYADRGRFSRFGVYLVHFSIFFIIAGAIVGWRTGFSADMVLNEGETGQAARLGRQAAAIDLPFSVRLDKFTVKFYPTGAPSEFRSDVTVIEEGREVHKAAVRVNHPLTWRGVTFYQSTYGRNFEKPFVLAVKRKIDGKTDRMEVRQGFIKELPDHTAAVGVADFHENVGGAGAAVRVVVRIKDGPEHVVWAFQRRPEGAPEAHGPYEVDLVDYQVGYYSGFQVNKDPGVWLIWAGCGLMILGFIVTFFFAHQRLYLGVMPKGKKTEWILAGSSHRNPGSFQIKFDRLAERLQRPVSMSEEK